MEQAKQKCWEAYRSNNPCQSAYMETDYKAGLEDGCRIGIRHALTDLRAQAAMSAMAALVYRGDNSPEHYARRAVAIADALIKELDRPC